MTRHPTRAEIEGLVSYLPIFSAVDFNPIIEWKGGIQPGSRSGTFPWPVYQPAVVDFFALAGRECWSDHDYAGKDISALIQPPGAIQAASLDQIKTILTYCVRGERFCDGHWAAVLQEGLVQRVLERLAGLLEGL